MFNLSVYLSSDEDSDVETRSIILKRIRDAANPLEVPDSSFKQLFRLSKPAFHEVFNEIKDELKVRSRSSSVPPILKLAAALRFFASGSYQRCVGQGYDIGMSQPEVSVVLTELLDVMERKLCSKWIKESNSEEKDATKRFFYEKYQLPGVIGCVDGTHVNLIRPSHSEHLFFNRKGRHSINTMIVCDHNMKITCVDAGHGGASHDAIVWEQGTLRRTLEENHNNGERNTLLLGDSGYPLQTWLITPFRAANDGSREAMFNTRHSKARCVVERTIGLLKARFRCLLQARELYYSPKKTSQIINVCCALHNICRWFSVENIQEDDIQEDATIEVLLSDNENGGIDNTSAISVRNDILNSLF